MKNLQNELKELYKIKNAFDSLLDHTSDFIYIKDKQHRFVAVSATFAKITNHKNKDDILGKTDFDIFCKEDATIYYDEQRKVLEDGIELLDIEEPYKNELGEQRWISTSKKPLFDKNNNIIGLIGISRDITRRKQLENNLKDELENQIKILMEKDQVIAQQTKLIAMGEMIENIAHQWRQPLNSINASVMIIADKIEEYNIYNEDINSELDDIEEITIYMSNTIDDFRNLYTQDKQQIKFKLSDILNRTISIVKKIFIYNNIVIKYKPSIDIELFNYKNELEQALLVILNNAKDALINNKVKNKTINIDIITDEQKVYIKISDNAGGIKEEYLEKIFEPYFTTKHKKQGIGLGLYTSKMLIEESMNGELLVANIRNGVVFTIILNKD